MQHAHRITRGALARLARFTRHIFPVTGVTLPSNWCLVAQTGIGGANTFPYVTAVTDLVS